jgi:two-component system, LuxR family, sensor kinase FixL
VIVRISDNGPGVRQPDKLFRPFGGGAPVASFGLYLSRAIVNSFQGELSYEALQPGARFLLSLQRSL